MIYPKSPRPRKSSYKRIPIKAGTITDTTSGVPLVMMNWPPHTTAWQFQFQYQANVNNLGIVSDFWEAMDGPFLPFTFREFWARRSANVLIADWIDGAPIFDLPADGTSIYSLTVNGLPFDAYSITPGGGTDGRDLLTLNTPSPPAGEVRADLGGFWYYDECRFQSFTLPQNARAVRWGRCTGVEILSPPTVRL